MFLGYSCPSYPCPIYEWPSKMCLGWSADRHPGIPASAQKSTSASTSHARGSSFLWICRNSADRVQVVDADVYRALSSPKSSLTGKFWGTDIVAMEWFFWVPELTSASQAHLSFCLSDVEYCIDKGYSASCILYLSNILLVSAPWLYSIHRVEALDQLWRRSANWSNQIR